MVTSYLDIDCLLRLGCAKVASLLKGQPLSKIRGILATERERPWPTTLIGYLPPVNCDMIRAYVGRYGPEHQFTRDGDFILPEPDPLLSQALHVQLEELLEDEGFERSGAGASRSQGTVACFED